MGRVLAKIKKQQQCQYCRAGGYSFDETSLRLTVTNIFNGGMMKTISRIASGVLIAVLASSLLAMKFYPVAGPKPEFKKTLALDAATEQSLIALARQADAVVVGKVSSADSYWSADGSLILTDFHLQTVEALQGSVPSVFVLTAEGGVVDDIRLEVCEGIKLEPLASYILFLQNKNDRIAVLDGSGGAYKIDSRQSLVQELKSIIHSIEKGSEDAKH
jgi:hypothetical protein